MIDKIKNNITSIVNSIDPWDLIVEGAPEDEYSSEIDQTISLLLNNKFSKENLSKIWNNNGLQSNEDKIDMICKQLENIKIDSE